MAGILKGNESFNEGVFGYIGQFIGISGGIQDLSHILDQIKFVTALLIPIPLGFLIKAAKDAQVKLALILLFGMGVQYFLYDICKAFQHNP